MFYEMSEPLDTSSAATHKRKQDMEDAFYKKQAGLTGIVSVLSPDGQTETIEVPPDKVGQIIGTRGAVIQDMQNRTGSKILLNQDFPPTENRLITITGSPHQVKQAGDLIKLIIQHGPTAIHVNSLTGGPQVTAVIDCLPGIVGRVIGSNGATIKDIQSRSGAKIQIDQNFPDGVPRKINVQGSQAAIQTATHLITYVMENGPVLPPLVATGGGGGFGQSFSNVQSFTTSNGSQHQIMDCPKMFVAKVIGRGGETISALQQRTGTKIQIEQKVPDGQPCRVNMTGPPQGLAMASQIISEIIMGIRTDANGPVNGSWGGGEIGGMGGGMGAAVGGGGGGMGGGMSRGMGGGMGGNMGGGMGGNMGGGMGGNMGGVVGGNMGGGIGGNMGGVVGSNRGGGMGGVVGSNMGSGMNNGINNGMGGMNNGMGVIGGGMNNGMGGLGGAMNNGFGGGMNNGSVGGMNNGSVGGGFDIQKPSNSYAMPPQPQPQAIQPPQQMYGGYGNNMSQQQQQQPALPQSGYNQPQGGMGGISQGGMYGQLQQQQPQQPQSYPGYPRAAISAPLPMAKPPSPWTEHKTEDGNTYWYNTSTGVSQVCTCSRM